jgi:hypothetical protein
VRGQMLYKLIDDGDSILLTKPEIGKTERPGEKCTQIPTSCPTDTSKEPHRENPSEKDWPQENFIH